MQGQGHGGVDLHLGLFLTGKIVAAIEEGISRSRQTDRGRFFPLAREDVAHVLMFKEHLEDALDPIAFSTSNQTRDVHALSPER